MSLQWMPFYVGDYLADTGHLTTVQHGAYLLLIMHYWRTGGLPDDDKQLASIARLPLKQWLSIEPVIKAFFHDGWRHKRIAQERLRASEKYERRAYAGRLGGLEKAKKIISIAKDLPVANGKQILPTTTTTTKESLSDSLSRTKSAERAKKLPSDFVLSEADIKFARERGWSDQRIQEQFERFCDHAQATGRRQVDWHAAWRTWVTSPYQEKVNINGRKQHPADRAFEIADKLDAAFERKVDPSGGVSGSGTDAVGLLEWRRSS